MVLELFERRPEDRSGSDSPDVANGKREQDTN